MTWTIGHTRCSIYIYQLFNHKINKNILFNESLQVDCHVYWQYYTYVYNSKCLFFGYTIALNQFLTEVHEILFSSLYDIIRASFGFDIFEYEICKTLLSNMGDIRNLSNLFQRLMEHRLTSQKIYGNVSYCSASNWPCVRLGGRYSDFQMWLTTNTILISSTFVGKFCESLSRFLQWKPRAILKHQNKLQHKRCHELV